MATATAAAQAHPASMEGRGWDVASYRREILRSRDLSSCTLFRAVFSGHSDGPDPNVLLAAASSDGSLASFSFLSCISAGSAAAQVETGAALVDPVCVVQAQSSTAYDVRFYPDPQHFRDLEPAFDLVNPQHDGRWGALSPIPENNAIAINKQDGSIMVAAGDACTYCWDVETGKCKITIKGHADCLQSVAVRESNCQVVTGSVTARSWGELQKREVLSGYTPSIDQRTRHLKAHGSAELTLMQAKVVWSISVWSLLSDECIFSLDYHAPVQDLLFDKNQIVALAAELVLSPSHNERDSLLTNKMRSSVGVFCLHPSGIAAVVGYGGLVDVISEVGSHLCCTFGSRGLN